MVECLNLAYISKDRAAYFVDHIPGGKARNKDARYTMTAAAAAAAVERNGILWICILKGEDINSRGCK